MIVHLFREKIFISLLQPWLNIVQPSYSPFLTLCLNGVWFPNLTPNVFGSPCRLFVDFIRIWSIVCGANTKLKLEKFEPGLAPLYRWRTGETTELDG